MAKTGTAGFDSIDTSIYAGAAFVPQGYVGLEWGSSAVAENPSEFVADYPTSGYFTGLTSGDQNMFNNGGAQLDIFVDHGSFNFKSVEMTAAWDTKLTVDVYGYKAGTQVYHDTVVLTDAHATLEKFNYKGIDQVSFVPTTAGEVHDDTQGGSGTFMVFDDLSGKVFFKDTPANHVVDQGRASHGPIVTGAHLADAGHLPMMHQDLHHTLALA